ncbi:DUF192 domain-containing protein [Erythrobacter sp.]|jgi:uncharacterized membrane protein (UPF0127 family)|uniref:DUF192 domain-containing protein n=1 Tax=Erythrobacter sp. TaxID=1042 RepID=UPI002E9FE2E1|nr:DUF192 domain-containing protein [Erythrobacter sp.]
MVRFGATIGAIWGAALLVACSPQGGAQNVAVQDTPPAPPTVAGGPTISAAGLRLIDVAIESGARTHIFRTELAATSEQQSKGMMFRTEMGDDEGMLFPSYEPQARSFWMKNTPLPLDIIFIGPDRRITNIEAGVPYSTDSVFSDGPALAVFEIRGGLAEELEIGPGDRVVFDLPADAAP